MHHEELGLIVQGEIVERTNNKIYAQTARVITGSLAGRIIPLHYAGSIEHKTCMMRLDETRPDSGLPSLLAGYFLSSTFPRDLAEEKSADVLFYGMWPNPLAQQPPAPKNIKRYFDLGNGEECLFLMNYISHEHTHGFVRVYTINATGTRVLGKKVGGRRHFMSTDRAIHEYVHRQQRQPVPAQAIIIDESIHQNAKQFDPLFRIMKKTGLRTIEIEPQW